MVDKQQLDAMGEHMREMEECKPEFKVPDGWKLVPMDPTDSMCYDGQQAGSTAYADPDGIAIVDLWEAMLSAAPVYKP